MRASERALGPAGQPRLLARIWPGAGSRRIRQDIEALASRIAVLERRADVLEDWSDILEKRTQTASPAMSPTSAQRSDDQAAHQVTARRYRQFLDQDLMGALHWASQHGQPSAGMGDARVLAETARDICACLFSLPVVSREGVYNLLAIPGIADEGAVGKLIETASQLRRKAAFARTPPWYFSYVPGVQLDSEYQEPWRRCEPDAPARWVVAPAYVAEGLVVVRQRVYTQR